MNEHPADGKVSRAMRCADLRFWVREFLTDPYYGWSGDRKALGKAFGTKPYNLKTIADGTRWIYPPQMLAFSRVIERLLAGELVPRDGKAVLVSDPVPVTPKPRTRYQYVLGRGLVMTPIAPPRAPARLPSVKTWAQNPRKWYPDPDKGPSYGASLKQLETVQAGLHRTKA